MLKRIVLPSGFGQTCAQLFQISYWIPAARQFGLPLYFPGFAPYADWFRGTANRRLPRFPRAAPPLGPAEAALAKACALAARVHGRVAEPFFMAASALPGVVTFSWDESGRSGVKLPAEVIADPRVAAGTSLWARGWHCRDEAGVREQEACIRDFFSPAPDLEGRVNACIQRHRQDDAVLVGVHLRRGDYRHWHGGRFFYDDATFCRLMRQACEALPGRKVRFLMVSNQPVDRDGYRGLDTAMGPGDPPGDLLSLAACDYLIGPPSTFTMWASFFGNVPRYTIDDPSAALQVDRFVVAMK